MEEGEDCLMDDEIRTLVAAIKAGKVTDTDLDALAKATTGQRTNPDDEERRQFDASMGG